MSLSTSILVPSTKRSVRSALSRTLLLPPRHASCRVRRLFWFGSLYWQSRSRLNSALFHSRLRCVLLPQSRDHFQSNIEGSVYLFRDRALDSLDWTQSLHIFGYRPASVPRPNVQRMRSNSEARYLRASNPEKAETRKSSSFSTIPCTDISF